MNQPPLTPKIIAQLEAEIAAFEEAAFRGNLKLADRKKRMTFIANTSADREIGGLFFRGIGYLAKHPEWVRGEILKAKDRLEMLRTRVESQVLKEPKA